MKKRTCIYLSPELENKFNVWMYRMWEIRGKKYRRTTVIEWLLEHLVNDDDLIEQIEPKQKYNKL